MTEPTTKRPNQKARTRKDLLQAASRMMKSGRKPSIEDVATEAMVSRATAYRYFPTVEALLVEASVDTEVPEPDAMFQTGAPKDPVLRLQHGDAALPAMIPANEVSIRMMLANSMQQGLRPGGVPARQNRRLPLIEAALAPARADFKPAALKTLSRALALVIGTEAMVVCKDVLQLDDAEARKVKRWAIAALVAAARTPA